jgi:BirA family transcriptional regulator, biotin operon repressor / biotin---[acetyl-CoA-carboxylase] ligase
MFPPCVDSKLAMVPADPGNPIDLERIREETFVRGIEYREETRSTNDLALWLARSTQVDLPLLVLAERQMAGRGRGIHRWWSAPGALTFSLLVEIDPVRLSRERAPLISLMTALAVGDALQDVAPEIPVGLKWPNDVLIGSRKVAGILIERPPQSAGRQVIGIGLNVNNSFAAAPAELQALVVSLADAAQRAMDRTAVLVQVLRRLAAGLDLLIAGRWNLRDRWAPRCVLSGRAVQVGDGPHAVRGVCQGLDEHGALLVQTPAGLARSWSGSVHLAPGAGTGS